MDSIFVDDVRDRRVHVVGRENQVCSVTVEYYDKHTHRHTDIYNLYIYTYIINNI